MRERKHSISFPETGRTKQEFKEECDINHMIAKFQKTGVAPPVNRGAGGFGDFSDVPDFHTAMTRVREAETAFMRFPSDIRERFRNDPAEMIEFLDNDENELEAIELGLIPGKPQPPGEDPAQPGPGPTNPEEPPTDPPETGAGGESSATP